MKIFKLKFIFYLFFLTFLSSCQTTTSGIGMKVSSTDKGNLNSSNSIIQKEKKESIDVLNIGFNEAIELAFEAGKKAYKNVVIADNNSSVIIENRSFWSGDARAIIDPIIIKNNKNLGIIYEIKAEGIGANYSMVPGYISDAFFKELKKLIKKNKINVLKLYDYEKLDDKGITEVISASVPIEYDQFLRFIDNKDDIDQFEGVWQDDNGRYTIGLLRTNDDPRFIYKAFIIESKVSNWDPGDVKIKFSKLDSSGIGLGKYYLGNKLERGVTFQTTDSSLVSMNTGKLSIVFIKVYPRDKSIGRSKGSGSGFHIGKGYFVTNAHVVKNAKKIKIILNNEEYSGRVSVYDEKHDLAIIKAKSAPSNMAKINFSQKYKVGQHIFVLGHPLGKMLGNSIKITDGIISSNEGIKGDPTMVTISAPIQPGNSGGPVVDDFGNLVGIVVAKLKNEVSSDKDVENINYAINIDYLKPLLKQINLKLEYGNNTKVDICEKVCGSVVRIETN